MCIVMGGVLTYPVGLRINFFLKLNARARLIEVFNEKSC